MEKSTFQQFFVPYKSPLIGKNIKNLRKEYGIKIRVLNSMGRCWSRTIRAKEPIIIEGDLNKVRLFRKELYRYVPKL
jgi:hypothetical protein